MGNTRQKGIKGIKGIKTIVLKKEEKIERKNHDLFEDEWYTTKKQKGVIMKLFSQPEPEKCGDNTFNIFSGKKDEKKFAIQLKRDIQKKISGYFAQDKKKNIDERKSLITFEQILEKFISASFKCHYCKIPVLFQYKHVRESKQWTLDRVDNAQCHSDENTVLCCLKCNLERRVTDDKKFLYTKQVVIVKKK